MEATCGNTVRGHRSGTVSPVISPHGGHREWFGPVSWYRFKLVPRVFLWFEPKASRSRNQLIAFFHLPGLGQTMPLRSPPHTALPALFSVFDRGRNVVPLQQFLSGYEPLPNGETEAILTPEGLSVGLMPRYFSVRATSKFSSETSCSNTNDKSNCQDEGISLRGANNDFDNPVGIVLGKLSASAVVTKKRMLTYLWIDP